MNKRFFRAGAAAVLVFALVLTCACSGGIGRAKPTKKIVILTAPETQNAEEYRRAATLAEKYPEFTAAVGYSSTSSGSTLPMYSEAMKLAEDESVGAVIFARANRGALATARAIREKNADILLLCTSPEEDAAELGEVFDAVFAEDGEAQMRALTKKSADAGAEVLLFYTHARHAENIQVQRAVEAAQKLCAEQSVEFRLVNCYDPASAGGVKSAQSFIAEDISRQMKLFEGKKIAVYSTEPSVQSKLAEQALSRGLIFAGGFTSAGDALAPMLQPDVKNSDNGDELLKAVKAGLKSARKASGEDSAFIYPEALGGALMLESAFEYARALLCGEEKSAEKIIKKIFDGASVAENTELDGCYFISLKKYKTI